MTEQERINGLRAVSRKCRNELREYKNLTDEVSTRVLKKYMPEFTTLLTSEQINAAPTVIRLAVSVRKIDEEMNNG